jgi:hypothetical protein
VRRTLTQLAVVALAPLAALSFLAMGWGVPACWRTG